MSEQSTSAIGISVKAIAYAPCPSHGFSTQFCGCPPIITGLWDHPCDISVQQLAQIIQCNILNTNVSGTDTGGTLRNLPQNTASTGLLIVAGSGSASASFTDNALAYTQANSNYQITPTVNALSGSSFTVTGTIVNGSSATIGYTEVGQQVTLSTFKFLVSHDTGSALTVSTSGSLAVTYTWTFT